MRIATVARQRLYRASRSRAAAQEIDAYEMHWADLSRFPVGLRRIVFTLFALVDGKVFFDRKGRRVNVELAN